MTQGPGSIAIFGLDLHCVQRTGKRCACLPWAKPGCLHQTLAEWRWFDILFPFDHRLNTSAPGGVPKLWFQSKQPLISLRDRHTDTICNVVALDNSIGDLIRTRPQNSGGENKRENTVRHPLRGDKQRALH